MELCSSFCSLTVWLFGRPKKRWQSGIPVPSDRVVMGLRPVRRGRAPPPHELGSRNPENVALKSPAVNFFCRNYLLRSGLAHPRNKRGDSQMITLASSTCARRVLIPLAAFIGVLLTTGCGSSNGRINTLGGGFTRASLKGQYVIAHTGTGINSTGASADPFSETIVFTSDGAGNLNVTLDDFNQDGVTLHPTLPETGTYAIASDGTGSLSFGGASYAITMIDDGHFYVMEQDSGATSSGYGELQDTTAFTAPPSGNYVFKSHSLGVRSRVGGITITGGAITGTGDLLDIGMVATSVGITSSVAMTAPATSGRGTFTLSDGTAFFYYVVNSGKFRFISNTGTLEIGMAEAQSGTFSLATLTADSSYVFDSSGETTASAAQGIEGIHSAGVFSSDGAGNITGGAVDFVQDTTVNSNLAVSGGTYTLAATGRGTLNLTLTGGTISPQIFWMVNSSRAYFLVNSATAVEDGTFSLQSGAPFTALTAQAAFNMDGFDTTDKDRVGVFDPTGTGFKWNQEANAFSGVSTVSTLGTTGTYQVGSNGRVAVVVNGVTSNLVFYLSSPNTGFMVQEDANIGGAFSQQASQ